MTGYLDESDIMMVEEGFTIKDLLENLLMEVSHTVRGTGVFRTHNASVSRQHQGMD